MNPPGTMVATSSDGYLFILIFSFAPFIIHYEPNQEAPAWQIEERHTPGLP